MSTKRILILDDDRQLQQIMETALRKEGYEITCVENGKEGEALIREQRPDLVLLDVMMPGKTGLDICEDLKRDPEFKDIRLLMLTCMTGESERNDDYWRKETGADDFLTKPFPLGVLIKHVQALIGPAEKQG